ncbi:hypothetical protein [Streptosporangium sandarakinum]|uniref:hypothetical protein n=1 Tax=Streptosporangium sandarakinum TaxID=1260955 RepID=UPI0037B2B882
MRRFRPGHRDRSGGTSSDGASSDGASSDGASSDGASSDGASSDGASSGGTSGGGVDPSRTADPSEGAASSGGAGPSRGIDPSGGAGPSRGAAPSGGAEVSGRRYRFGRLAALAAVGYATAVAGSVAVAAVMGEGDAAWWLVTHEAGPKPPSSPGWFWLPLLPSGAFQGWMLWQILRGRVAGPFRAPDGDVRRLRAMLYVDLVWYLVMATAPFPVPWTGVVHGFMSLALAVLFHRVLTGASRLLRRTALVAGLVAAVSSVGQETADLLDLHFAEQVFDLVGLSGLLSSFWMVLVLVAQARDGRWGRATVWSGVGSLLLPVVLTALFFSDFVWSSDLAWFDGFALPGSPGLLLLHGVTGAFHLFGPVWLARSAHDLGDPRARAVPYEERRPPVRAPLGPWPPAVAAVALPMVSAAVNLAYGLPFWFGPRGMIEYVLPALPVRLMPGSLPLLRTGLDLLAGPVGLTVAALAAVVRRTRGSARWAAGALLLNAAAGVVVTLTAPTGPLGDATWAAVDASAGSQPDFISEGFRAYLTWVSAPESGAGGLLPGFSPLWGSAAFTASAIILLLRYGGRPARSPYRTAAAALAVTAALCLVPAADHVRGPSTSRAACERLRATAAEYGRRDGPSPMSEEKRFVCEVRTSDVLPSGRNASDQELVAYGRRLCGVHTRNDPAEIARVRAADGVHVPGLTHTLGGICPSAAAVVRARAAAEDREFREWEADQRRRCDAMPRHRPLIRPDSVTVHPEPVWTDYGELVANEDDPEAEPSGADAFDADPSGTGTGTGTGSTDASDASDADPRADETPDSTPDPPPGSELTEAGPGYLAIRIHSDYPLCVTVERYARRPPVETRGWHHVVEVGYRSPTGTILAADPMGGEPLPDLALRGRKGHYRIRVHYAWTPWKGERLGAQRLLIMAYPGRGEEAVVHRRRAEP